MKVLATQWKPDVEKTAWRNARWPGVAFETDALPLGIASREILVLCQRGAMWQL